MDDWNEQGMLDEFEALVSFLAENMEEGEDHAEMIDPLSMKKISFCEDVLKWLFRDQPVSIETKLHEPFRSTGSVTVRGKYIEIPRSGMEWFARAAEFANGVSIGTLVDGTIEIGFGFSGLTTRI